MKYIYQWNEKDREIRLFSAAIGSDVSEVVVSVGGSTEFKPSQHPQQVADKFFIYFLML